MLPRRPVKADHWAKAVKSVMEGLGLDPRHYGCHSLRVGGATELFAAGVRSEIIQLLGRWRSDTFKDYVRVPIGVLVTASRGIAGAGPPLFNGTHFSS